MNVAPQLLLLAAFVGACSSSPIPRSALSTKPLDERANVLDATYLNPTPGRAPAAMDSCKTSLIRFFAAGERDFVASLPARAELPRQMLESESAMRYLALTGGLDFEKSKWYYFAPDDFEKLLRNPEFLFDEGGSTAKMPVSKAKIPKTLRERLLAKAPLTLEQRSSLQRYVAVPDWFLRALNLGRAKAGSTEKIMHRQLEMAEWFSSRNIRFDAYLGEAEIQQLPFGSRTHELIRSFVGDGGGLNISTYDTNVAKAVFVDLKSQKALRRLRRYTCPGGAACYFDSDLRIDLMLFDPHFAELAMFEDGFPIWERNVRHELAHHAFNKARPRVDDFLNDARKMVPYGDRAQNAARLAQARADYASRLSDDEFDEELMQAEEKFLNAVFNADRMAEQSVTQTLSRVQVYVHMLRAPDLDEESLTLLSGLLKAATSAKFDVADRNEFLRFAAQRLREVLRRDTANAAWRNLVLVKMESLTEAVDEILAHRFVGSTFDPSLYLTVDPAVIPRAREMAERWPAYLEVPLRFSKFLSQAQE